MTERDALGALRGEDPVAAACTWGGGAITRESGTAEKGGPLSRLCSAEIDMASTFRSIFSSRDRG